jgi:hypothetical protein
MKVSAIAAALAAAGLLATDAKPETITAELNKLLAADKKARDEAKEAEEKKAAADKAAKDAEKDGADDPEGVDEDPEVEDEFPEKPEGGAEKPAKTNVKDGKRGKDKAMDSASVATLIAANDAKHAAAREVESILGVVSFDSADKYYKAALDKLGVDTAGVHASAFPALLKIAKDSATAASASIVGDAAAVTGMATGIKGYGRLR